MVANDKQVGGNHYKKGGEEHWDRAWRLDYDPFQYIITKWVERWKDKGGIQDLEKARHAIDKYIEVAKARDLALQGLKAGASLSTEQDRMMDELRERQNWGEEAGPGYVNQD